MSKMKVHGLKLVMAFFVMFYLTPMHAQTVTYDGGTVNRPTQIIGLVVNGATYDVNFIYNNATTHGTFNSGIPIGTETAAVTALVNLLNQQGIDSDFTELHVFSKQLSSGLYAQYRLYDHSSGTNMWEAISTRVNQTASDGISTGNSYAALAFTSSTPVPTMNQWGLLIFGLLIMNLSVFFVQRRALI